MSFQRLGRKERLESPIPPEMFRGPDSAEDSLKEQEGEFTHFDERGRDMMNRCRIKLWGCLAMIGAAAAVGPAWAQAPGAQPGSAEDQTRNQKQDARLAALEQRLANIEGDLAMVIRNQTELTGNQRALQQIASELDASLRQLVERGASGNPYVNLRANMQEPEFRTQFRGAVHESIDRSGTLQVENQLGTQQHLQVNGQSYYLAPFETRNITVPVGTVMTELVGYEAPKHLTVSAPTYFQRLLIRPTVSPPHIVRRPIQQPDIIETPVQIVEQPVIRHAYYYPPLGWW